MVAVEEIEMPIPDHFSDSLSAGGDCPRECARASFICSDDTVEEFDLFCAVFHYFRLKHDFQHSRTADK